MAAPPVARSASAARWPRSRVSSRICSTRGSPASRWRRRPWGASSMRSRTMPARPATRSNVKAPELGPIAAYKAILKGYIDRRPAGMRARIAGALGKHKSFVSQLTNPIYPMPIPARHVSTILEICHFSAEERKTFLKAYASAHPASNLGALPDDGRMLARPKGLSPEIPLLRDPRRQRALEALLRQFVERVFELVER